MTEDQLEKAFEQQKEEETAEAAEPEVEDQPKEEVRHMKLSSAKKHTHMRKVAEESAEPDVEVAEAPKPKQIKEINEEEGERPADDEESEDKPTFANKSHKMKDEEKAATQFGTADHERLLPMDKAEKQFDVNTNDDANANQADEKEESEPVEEKEPVKDEAKEEVEQD